MIKKEISAGVIVYLDDAAIHERLYLLLHYAGGHWDLPKGKLEKGESFTQAALRELKEETGLTATIHTNFQESLEYMFSKTERGQKIKIDKKVIFFLGKSTEKEVTISHEHIGFIWLPYKDAFNRLTYQNAQHILHIAHEFLEQEERFCNTAA